MRTPEQIIEQELQRLKKDVANQLNEIRSVSRSQKENLLRQLTLTPQPTAIFLTPETTAP